MQSRPRPKKYVRHNRKARPITEGKPNLELRPYQVLIRPLVTEKGTHLSTHHNAYTFMVNMHATKIEVKAAVQELFNVRVVDVRTQIRHGKKRRYRTRIGATRDWKRAIVTLHVEDKIEFYEWAGRDCQPLSGAIAAWGDRKQYAPKLGCSNEKVEEQWEFVNTNRLPPGAAAAP